jgi:glycosyltransferase involved in cell wall biosynthesis
VADFLDLAIREDSSHLGFQKRSGAVTMKSPIVIATIMRPAGVTGVQTHFNTLRTYLQGRLEAECVTPFDYFKVMTYPVFAVRRLLDPISGPASVWWYRYWHYLFLKYALRRRLRHLESAIVYAQCPLSAKAALEARTSPNQRVVTVVHFNLSQAEEWAEKGRISRGGPVYRRIIALETNTLHLVDGLVFVSQYMREQLCKRIPALTTVRAAVVPNFVHIPPGPFDFTAPAADLITVGTLEPRKNQSFLIRVVADCAARGQRYSLSIVGDGPDRDALKRLAHELGVEAEIRFLGFRHDAAALMSGHRAYCHAATIENMPLTLIEALSRGLPILAAPVGGIPEVFADGIEGKYWQLDDVHAAAETLMSLLGDEACLLAMSNAARHRFEQRFEADRVARILVDFLCDRDTAVSNRAPLFAS